VASLGCWLGDGEAAPTDELEVALDVWKWGVAGVDPSGLRAESNVLLLWALDRVSLRLSAEVEQQSLELAMAIAARLDVVVDLSSPVPLPDTDATVEGEATYVDRLNTLAVSRVRLPRDAEVARLAALDAGFEVDTTPLSRSGRHEVVHWVREQTISATRHRHGNVHGDEVHEGSG
jgi:RHH-type proline utilization regulon transcriptional repressor/proline dehydrogenase/delta 1-pyrroline-5-carboxylate dehydrogenase